MLVLSRKVREAIVIKTPNGVITVSVDSIRGNAVRIGVDAPKHFGVWRKEIDDQIFRSQGGGQVDHG
jgi:carbon storage regulator